MKPKIGDDVKIFFYDHAENATDAPYFKVYGELIEETKMAYKVLTWGYVNPADKTADDHPNNEHSFVIVKKAIETIEIL